MTGTTILLGLRGWPKDSSRFGSGGVTPWGRLRGGL